MHALYRRAHSRGFTLIELIATITIIGILAAVALPRLDSASPSFSERGYADVVSASLRQARAVAMTSGCAVQFTIDNAGYRALQRGAGANNHCAGAGAFVTAVQRGDSGALEGTQPADAALPNNVQFVFDPAGAAVGGPYNIAIGAHVIDVDAGGWVTLP